VAQRPAREYLVLLAAAAAADMATDRAFAGASRRDLHLRLSVDAATTTAVAYATGWGPVLAIGYMFLASRAIGQDGAGAAAAALAWSLAGIAAGQAAVAAGVAPTLAPLPAVHGLAALGALGLTMVVRTLRSAAMDKERYEDDLAKRAYHDPLTGLANRAAFLARLERVVARGRRQPRPFAVLFLDLDRFKAVNDRLGHDTGDRLLVEVAERLTACLRADDTLARMGGDEFTVLMEDMAARDEAVQVAERVLDSLRRPFLLAGQALSVSTSIGIVVSDGDETAPGDLLCQADLAMYRAKEKGRSCWQLVDATSGTARR